MRRQKMNFTLILLFHFFILFLSLFNIPITAIQKSYVVYLGAHSHGAEPSNVDFDRVTDLHHHFLGSFLGSKEKAKGAMHYSYTRHINGFAATLDEASAAEILKHPDVVSVFPNMARRLHTTHSWEYLGLVNKNKIPTKSIWKKAKFGEDVIIGCIDSGVWPESESFNDEGMGPVPARWKGFCEDDTENGVRCNRKLIGARYFSENVHNLKTSLYATARDMNGHGTHTLSTAGGRFVPNANIFGVGNGTASGGAPSARVAMYKACWPVPKKGTEMCPDADIIAAFDAAIHDGVDVLSVSLGDSPNDYLSESISIGAFHAVMKGIPVICAAGNDGPQEGSVDNVAPWILTVGASTMDRDFVSYVVLNNQTRLAGRSLSSKALPDKRLYPLISAVDGKVADAPDDYARVCSWGSLDPEKVIGKIVVCFTDKHPTVWKGIGVGEAGGIGMILVSDQDRHFTETSADPHFLPATHISAHDGLKLLKYIASTKSPVAYITPAETEMDVKPAPVIASFSSRGPNRITPEILKPDIVAPGVSIISAFTLASGPSGLTLDERRVPFNSFTGTSMACPHVSGVVALLKAIHPDWSPAAIKSAIMTTAGRQRELKKPTHGVSKARGTPFSYGAGLIQPDRAADPGLVYDLTVDDYVNFLCAFNYNKSQIANFTIEPRTCTDSTNLLDFNYPAITVPTLTDSLTVTRTVKNVGSPGRYTVNVTEPFGVSVKVEPESLKFTKLGEEKAFSVTMEMKADVIDNYVFGELLWSDGRHYVRSPISVMGGARTTE